MFENEELIIVGNKEYIPIISEDYYKYYDYIKTKFFNIDTTDYKEYIKLLNLLRDIIINEKSHLYDRNGFNINKDINNIKLLEAVANNIYREEYLNKQKILHK